MLDKNTVPPDLREYQVCPIKPTSNERHHNSEKIMNTLLKGKRTASQAQFELVCCSD